MKEWRHTSPLAALKCKGRPAVAAAERSRSRILVQIVIGDAMPGLVSRHQYQSDGLRSWSVETPCDPLRHFTRPRTTSPAPRHAAGIWKSADPTQARPHRASGAKM